MFISIDGIFGFGTDGILFICPILGLGSVEFEISIIFVSSKFMILLPLFDSSGLLLIFDLLSFIWTFFFESIKLFSINSAFWLFVFKLDKSPEIILCDTKFPLFVLITIEEKSFSTVELSLAEIDAFAKWI